MSIIIIYNSKTGFTKKYADWIAAELNCSVLPYKDLPKATITTDDIVIFGSRVHAGKIEHLNKVKLRFVNKQSFIVFATGATPASETKAIDRIWTNNFTEAEISLIPHFYMQSGLNYENMGFIDRTIMKTVAKLMSGKEEKSETEAGFEQAIKSSYDITSREYIMPLANYVNGNFNFGRGK